MATDGLTIYRLTEIKDISNPDWAYAVLILVNSCINLKENQSIYFIFIFNSISSRISYHWYCPATYY